MIPGGVNELLLRSAAAGGATAGRSVRFNSADSAYLSRTPASAGNRRTSTLSFWTKKVTIGGGDRFIFSTSGDDVIRFNSDNKLRFYLAGTGAADLESTQLFRDPSAWYHFVFAFDTTQGTASDRIKVYLNGVQITAWGTATYPSQNYDMSIGNSVAHYFGRDSANANHYNGYLALVHYVNGQALTPSSFGETSAATGRWEAKTYGGTYGTNGFFLDFLDNSGATATTLGKDTSGNGNNWTPNNLSVTAGSGNDSLRDHPTSAGTSTGLGGEVSGNYCTWNPLFTNSGYTLSNGNLDIAGSLTNVIGSVATMSMQSGKWYWEVTVNNIGSNPSDVDIGIANNSVTLSEATVGLTSGFSWRSNGGFRLGAATANISGVSYTTGDVLSFALDVTTLNFWIGKNGSWLSSGNPTTGANPAGAMNSSSNFFAAIRPYGTGTSFSLNTGQRAFAYTAPSGFSPLVDTLLPQPTIALPNTVMDAVAYTGTGSSNTITLPGSFNPDFIWIKRRSAASDHVLMDVVRGFGSSATKILYSNLTNSEDTTSIITSTSSTGFTIGGSGIETNANGSTYVAWTWDAGSSNATNTSGTITSTVRANISAGFSICSFTWSPTGNGTFGHGLGAVPEFAIFKIRNITDSWWVYHKSIGNTNYLNLNTTGASTASSQLWNNTTPTSSVMTLGTNWAGDIIGYLWTPVAGYSAFGSYTGNGSSDGPFVYTGFRPRWILTKTTNRSGAGAESWFIHDAARDGYNFANQTLYPNLSNAEGGAAVDILSNGFKLRSSANSVNGGGDTYIYACFAEAPLPYARAR